MISKVCNYLGAIGNGGFKSNIDRCGTVERAINADGVGHSGTYVKYIFD